MHTFFRALTGLVALMFLTVAAAAATRPPNVIVILIDDMGATDLGCMGSKFFETPNIDRLAGQGMKFTQAYAACTVCSPTRAAMMTGKYPARLHLTDWITGSVRPFAKLKVPDWTKYLPLEEFTIAEALKTRGYATAQIGKWHLGGPDYFPTKQGFDLSLGGCDKGQPPSYFSPYKIPTLPDGPDGEYLTDREAAEACKFIAAHQDKPFYIYLAHYAVHNPIQSKAEVVAKYQKKAAAQPEYPQKHAGYAALVESVDDSVGRVMKQLDDLKLTDNTLVIFTSDNGGLILGGNTVNLGIRAGKGSAYEGGVRVPLVIRWPGVVKPGTTNETPVLTLDYYPTILEAAALPPQPGQIIDGESLVPLLKQTGPLKRDAIYWHYPHYHPGGATPYAAIRQGDLKLIHFYEDNHSEAYNLRTDPLEQQNLLATDPKAAEPLATKLVAWQKEVGAQFASPNPEHDPVKDRAPAGAKKKK
ncbi:MAG: DUF4976 domain-containing protein [Proteobacteria bacterium]|nr:DUF4976 domain-containing protein [Pseudomonadota bacterium]